jgi:hypothetical protein
VGELRKRDLASDILLVLGFTVLLWSANEPFLLLIKSPPPPDPYHMPRRIDYSQASFSSFKANFYTHDTNVNSIAFGIYWSFIQNLLSPSAFLPSSNVLMIVFVLQALTLVLSPVALVLRARTRILPLASSAVAGLLIAWLYSSLRSNMFLQWSLASGYWLTCGSISFYLASVMLSLRRMHELQ